MFTGMFLMIFSVSGVFSLQAQEWTIEQKEVWQEVENMFSNWKAGDVDAMFSNVHQDYLGWNEEAPLPMSKDKWQNSMKKYITRLTNLDFNIEPARIIVKGNVAVVHFYYEMSWGLDTREGVKDFSYKGKWSEFYIKENGKWMLLGDMTLGKFAE